ncbi:hypothetical protein A3709_20415 [Halioglobus sp. HI00S01]|uniref:GGDEF domain-containing protein n=1 Tax=Halioglobus sp. HI00S01 TaxID=1822214 RepID=UPI0007C27C3B|nr:GGDEF domain-containing protein [Halioglobus sp. HI00S01]KZX57977.1 hypothetical protein A3709_20415 [Halioglobus sp. HI00S01]
MVRPYIASAPGELKNIVIAAPYLLAVIGVICAVFFSKVRLLALAVGLSIAHYIIQTELQASLRDAATFRVYVFLALIAAAGAPASLALPDRGITTVWGAACAAIIAAITGACWIVAGWLPLSEEAGHPMSLYSTEGVVLPAALQIVLGAGIVCSLIFLTFRNTHVEAAAATLTACAGLVLGLLHLDDISLAVGAAASLCLIWCFLRESHKMAFRDDLTGLPSRRALNRRLRQLAGSYSIAMLDVDHFKKFNDTHGHHVGDQVLQLVAAKLSRARSGTAYRYGGEEFCIVFSRKRAEDVVPTLNDVRRTIEDYKMTLRAAGRAKSKRAGKARRGATKTRFDTVSVTVSGGVASKSDKHTTPEAVIEEADRLLYRAKRAGRNRIFSK